MTITPKTKKRLETIDALLPTPIFLATFSIADCVMKSDNSFFSYTNAMIASTAFCLSNTIPKYYISIKRGEESKTSLRVLEAAGVYSSFLLYAYLHH